MLPRLGEVDPVNGDSWRHDVAHCSVTELEDAIDQFVLGVLDHAPLGALLHQHTDLFNRDRWLAAHANTKQALRVPPFFLQR